MNGGPARGGRRRQDGAKRRPDRKSTRLNSSHSQISYAVFCLKKKKKKIVEFLSKEIIKGVLKRSHEYNAVDVIISIRQYHKPQAIENTVMKETVMNL